MKSAALISRARRTTSLAGWLASGIVLVAILLLNQNAFAGSSTNRIVHYGSRSWQMDEGLPQNGVEAIAQTPDGYLWVGTAKGLTRFDGAQFTVFDPKNTPELHSASIGALSVGSDGSLWIGTASGLTHFKDDKFSYHSLSSQWRGNNVKAIAEDAGGALWVGTLDGLFREQAGAWTTFTTNDGLRSGLVRSLCAASNALWIGTGSGLNEWTNGAIQTLPEMGDRLIRTVFQDRVGNVWVGSIGGLACLTNGEVKLYTKKDGLADNSVSALFQDRRGDLWVGTYDGLSRFTGGNLIFEKDSEGSFYDQVNAITEDQEGDIWMGTRDGLQELRVRQFTAYTRAEGLSHNNIMSVLQAHNGAIWIASWGGGLSRLEDGRVSNFTWQNSQTNGLPTDLALSLFEDRDGSILIGTDYEGGTFRLKDGVFSRIWNRQQAQKDRVIRVIYRDRESNLWFGAASGLILWNQNEHLLKDSAIRSLLEDHAGTLWVGTEAGLFCRTNGQFINWSEQRHQLPGLIHALYEDAAQTLWIGTGGSGLCRYKDGKLITYTTLQGLFSDDIFEIVEDDNGWLWMTCSKGIFRVSKKNLDDFDKHKTLSIRCIAYGKADGMESIQCSGVAKPGAWKGRDGRLWFATAKGLVVADPQLNLAGNDKLPAVIIEEVIADQQPSAIPAASGGSAALTIPPGRGDLEIHYTTTSLEEPEKNRFKYKLDGIDSDWVEVTRRVAYYNNLRPGNYQFHVIACNNDGVWNHAGASVALVLRPHLWQTWWFRGTAALLAALLAAGIARYLTRRNIQQELQRLEKQHAVEQERIRIARDMHDEIGAKLTKISFLGALAKRKISLPDEAGTQIDKMSQTARDVIRALDEIVWAVNPANDSLEDLATYLCRNATEFFDNSPIVCQFNIPAELPAWRLGMDVRHNLLLAAKEALNNVLKHSGATKVHVQISVVSEWFEVEIADNGRGFAQSDAANGSGSVSKKPSRVGNGLANMRQRLESIGGRCYVESRAGEGTRILFRIYVSGRVSDWISKRGEVAGMGKD